MKNGKRKRANFVFNEVKMRVERHQGQTTKLDIICHEILNIQINAQNKIRFFCSLCIRSSSKGVAAGLALLLDFRGSMK